MIKWAICLLMLASVPACKSDAGRAAGDDVAARVDDTVIRLSEVDRILEQQLRGWAQQGQAAPPTAAELGAARLKIVEGLITQEALHVKAIRADLIPTNDEVNQAIQKIKSDQQLSEEGFQRKLRDAGQTEHQFREDMKRQVAIQKLFDKEVTPRIAVTDREIEDFYNANRAQFVEKKGFLLSQILVDPEVNNVTDDAVGLDAANRKAAEIYEQLRKGADFATVAASRSEDPLTGPRGGTRGFIGSSAPGFPPVLLQRFATMREGAFTEPIKSGQTWYIFKLDRRVERDRELKLDEVRADIDKKLRADREEVLQTALTKIAMNEAKSENVLAERILANPSNFGSLRPISIPGTSPPADRK